MKYLVWRNKAILLKNKKRRVWHTYATAKILVTFVFSNFVHDGNDKLSMLTIIFTFLLVLELYIIFVIFIIDPLVG